MNRILVLITLSDNGIETIKSNPELPKKEMLKQIIKNAGSPIKTALSEFRKGHLVSPTKRILAVVIGLMVGLIMDTKKIFK